MNLSLGLHQSIELTKAYFIAVPPVHEQFYRPFQAHCSPDTINNFIYNLESYGITNPDATTVSQVASNIISPSIPQTRVNIPNGLSGTTRYAVFLEITVTLHQGRNFREIITGFTDYDGITIQNNINGQMKIYPNSFMKVNEVMQTGPSGQQVGLLMDATNQFLTSATTNQNTVSMRPDDVATTNLQNQYNLTEDYHVKDMTTDLSRQAVLAKRSHVSGADYLSTLLKGYTTSAQATGAGFIEDDDAGDDFYAKMSSEVRNPSSLATSCFAKALNLAGRDLTEITFDQISQRWPRSPDFWSITKTPPGQQIQTLRHNALHNSEHFQGSLIETSIAYSIAQSLFGLMTQIMCVQIDFSVTTNLITGQPEIIVTGHVPMFEGMVTNHHIAAFENQLTIHVVNALLKDKVGTYAIHAQCNIMDTAIISVSVDGHPEIMYVAPLFCDSYYSPLHGTQYNDLTSLSKGIDNLATQVTDYQFNTARQPAQIVPSSPITPLPDIGMSSPPRYSAGLSTTPTSSVDLPNWNQ